MSEKTPKSRWDTEHQRWIHPDLPTAAVSKRKVGRPRNDHPDNLINPGELEVLAKADRSRRKHDLEDELDDARYNAAIAATERKQKTWEIDQERLFGVLTFRDSQGNLVRDAEGKIVIQMSERFAELFLRAKDAGDVVCYPAGDRRGFVRSTDPDFNWGWKDADAAAKYGAGVAEIPSPNYSEDAISPDVGL